MPSLLALGLLTLWSSDTLQDTTWYNWFNYPQISIECRLPEIYLVYFLVDGGRVYRLITSSRVDLIEATRLMQDSLIQTWEFTHDTTFQIRWAHNWDEIWQ